MHPVAGLIRPWESGANRCGHASERTDHCFVSSLYHTARSMFITLTEVGDSDASAAADPMGIHAPSCAPPSDNDVDESACSIKLVEAAESPMLFWVVREDATFLARKGFAWAVRNNRD